MSLSKAKTLCRKLAVEHYGSTRFFDEDKMIEALVKRGASKNVAMDAIILVQADQ